LEPPLLTIPVPLTIIYVNHIITSKVGNMKRNLTLAIDEEVLSRARVAATQKKRTLTGMVREYLETVAGENHEKNASLERLLKAVRSKPLRVGRPAWRRDDLHAR
jgi:hypothetical protein